jgi:GMP synthase (glutamine-hydrolysing)
MMGGPMGVYEGARYPWIPCQRRRLARRLAADRPTLGVCFGAQMIAAALGAAVVPGPAPEIGFAPLDIHAEARSGPLRHLVGVPVLHWHGDTFALPTGGRLLASSSAYPNQAFQYGANVLALQFHAEMGTDERFEAWISQAPEAIAAADRDAESLRRDYDALGPAAVAAGQTVIADWLARLR